MHKAFARPALITSHALICALFLIVIPTTAVASASSAVHKSPSKTAATNSPSARLMIKSGVFGRATVVVAKGGTLTLANVDSVAYRTV